MQLSILTCTHNPRRDYLERTLAALRAQTLPATEWELVVVDNASSPGVSTFIDIDWHPNARIVGEPTLGLTPARMRAIREAKTDLLVFVDDDNVLAPDFLAEALRLAKEMPFIGAFGCSIRGVYEKEPTQEVREWLWLLTVGEIQHARWSNLGLKGGDAGTLPSGAGLVIRAAVAREYAQLAQSDPLRASLDRRGADLTGSGDHDLAATCSRLGLGTGRFPTLKLDHLMSANRVEKDYLARLAEGSSYSSTLLHFLHGIPWQATHVSRTRRWLAAWENRHLAPFERRMHEARSHGEARARALIETHLKSMKLGT